MLLSNRQARSSLKYTGCGYVVKAGVRWHRVNDVLRG